MSEMTLIGALVIMVNYDLQWKYVGLETKSAGNGRISGQLERLGWGHPILLYHTQKETPYSTYRAGIGWENFFRKP